MKQISKPVFLRYGRFRNLLVFVELFDYTVMFFCRLFIGDANQKQIPAIFFQCIYIMLFFYLADRS